MWTDSVCAEKHICLILFLSCCWFLNTESCNQLLEFSGLKYQQVLIGRIINFYPYFVGFCTLDFCLKLMVSYVFVVVVIGFFVAFQISGKTALLKDFPKILCHNLQQIHILWIMKVRNEMRSWASKNCSGRKLEAAIDLKITA